MNERTNHWAVFWFSVSCPQREGKNFWGSSPSPFHWTQLCQKADVKSLPLVREWMTVWVWTHGGASINKCCIISICQKNVAIHTWRCHFSQCRRSDLERGRQQRALWLTFHGGNTGNKGKKKKKTQVKTECVWTSNTRRKRQNQTNTGWEGEENGRTDRFCGRSNQTRKIKSQSCDWCVIRH